MSRRKKKKNNLSQPRPPRLSGWRQRKWSLLLIGGLLIAVGVATVVTTASGHDAHFYALKARQAAVDGDRDQLQRSLERARELLPRLGRLEQFREQQQSAREICRQLQLPEVPDISPIDDAGQELFYQAFQGLRRDPHDPAQYGLLGRLYEAQTFPEHASALYRRAIEFDPDDHQWHYQLALLLAKQSDLLGAARHFARAGKLDPKYAPGWMRRAWLNVEQGRPQEALEMVNRYLELRGSDPFGFVQRAKLFADAQQWELAKQDLDRARNLGSVGRQGHRLLGRYFAHEKNVEESRLHAALSAEAVGGDNLADPLSAMPMELATFRHPVLTRFVTLAQSELWHEALALSDQVLAKYQSGSADHARVCGRIAECHYELGNYTPAENFLLRALETFPDDPPAHGLYAMLNLQTGRLEAALQHAEKSLGGDPDSLSALHARSMARIGLASKWLSHPTDRPARDPHQAVELARADIERCLGREPVNATYLMILATAQGMLEDFPEAIESLDKALRITPNDDFLKMLKRRAEANESFWFKM